MSWFSALRVKRSTNFVNDPPLINILQPFTEMKIQNLTYINRKWIAGSRKERSPAALAIS
jgi:hypothetical protein